MLISLIILIAGVALAALVYGLFSLIVKLAGKENYLLTLSLTKRLFGDKWGKILHYLFFQILPLLISIWLTICVIIAVNQNMKIACKMKYLLLLIAILLISCAGTQYKIPPLFGQHQNIHRKISNILQKLHIFISQKKLA